jgi:hypothetical protein
MRTVKRPEAHGGISSTCYAISALSTEEKQRDDDVTLDISEKKESCNSERGLGFPRPMFI